MGFVLWLGAFEENLSKQEFSLSADKKQGEILCSDSSVSIIYM